MQEIAAPIILALLILATVTDLRTHRIPNVLSLGGLLIALVLQTTKGGTDGLLAGLGGMAIGLALFLPFYALRAMGAGDVKMMAAVGAFLGPKLALASVAATLMCGTLLALVYIAVRGGASLTFRRYALMAKTLMGTHHFVYVKPQAGDAGAARFPYALAILAGTASALAWNNGWL